MTYITFICIDGHLGPADLGGAILEETTPINISSQDKCDQSEELCMDLQ